MPYHANNINIMTSSELEAPNIIWKLKKKKKKKKHFFKWKEDEYLKVTNENEHIWFWNEYMIDTYLRFLLFL